MNILWVACWLIFGNWHPVHVSVCEVAHNEREHTLEISLKVFVDDMAQALTERTGQEIAFSDDLTDSVHDSLIVAYLADHFTISLDGKPVLISMLGKDGKGEDLWIYMTAPAGAFHRMTVRQDVLFDEFADQQNFIHFRRGNYKHSATCTVPSPVAEFIPN
ncbi:MAG: hypothetical protein H6585_05785 [Flavobacteriales bacterium]|nr:hypothetical protein [Flavobacteriales bacterium]